jgi:hypothetical protein
MACPLFAKQGNRCSCLAVRGEVTPTLHERESFCSTIWHQACPMLVARLRKGRALSEPEYLALWMGDAEMGQRLEPAS